MLPALPLTDVFKHKASLDAIDIWTPHWRRGKSYRDLGGPGVYCFYDADTGEVLYIGSSCARSAVSASAGLCDRLRKYYTQRQCENASASVRRINAERSRRRILMRCWRTATMADALKYEFDAIARYAPAFNRSSCRTVQSLNEKRQAMAASAKRRRDRLRQQNLKMYSHEDTSQPKTCTKCLRELARADFNKNPCTKDGRHYVCKTCISDISHQKYVKYRKGKPCQVT